MTEMVRLAEKAKQPIEVFVRTAQVLEEHEAKAQSERRATPEEKATIAKYLDELAANGPVTSDIPTMDILAAAGVRKAQGTTSCVTRELKRVLLLTDRNAAIRMAAA
jgi:hypothetical protein